MTNKINLFSVLLTVLLLLSFAFNLTACGGGNWNEQELAEQADDKKSIPTNPPPDTKI